jgi:molybdopterin synthase catalytic subunit
MSVMIARVTDEQLDVAAHERAVTRSDAGAHVLFSGVVREHDHGRNVSSLLYEAHPTAAMVLQELAAEIAARPEVLSVALSHRVGDLQVGDVALVAGVSCAHRAAAFEACALMVNEIKRRLPVWKHQIFTDGSDEWVNCP